MATEQAKRRTIPEQIYDLGDAVSRSIVQHERAWLLAVLSLFGFAAAYRAWVVPLWFDEFFTLHISRLPSFATMLKAMPADGQPPLQYLLTRVALTIPGELEFMVRLPEILAYLASGLLAYAIVRQHGEAPRSLFAMVLMLGAQINQEQASTARPYELLLLGTAITYLSWQIAASRYQRRQLALLGVAGGIACSVLAHHFGIFHVGLFLITGETVRLAVRRRLDIPMIVAVFCGFIPVLFTMNLARESRRVMGDAVHNSLTFWAKPTMSDLSSYLHFTAVPMLSLAVLAAVILLRVDSTRCRETLVPSWEWASAVSLFLLLPVVLLLAHFETGYFVERYAVSSALGLSILICWVFPGREVSSSSTSSAFSLGLVGYLVGFAVWVALLVMVMPAWSMPGDHWGVSPLLNEQQGRLPIVVANVEDFTKDWWYAPSTLKARLTYLIDIDYAVQQRGFIGELSVNADRAFLSFPVEDYAPFVRSHKEFLLLESGGSQYVWLPKRFGDEGWKLDVIARQDKDVLYRVSRP